MASRIILDPETLLAQAGEMQNLTAEYEALFSKVTGTLMTQTITGVNC